MPEYYEIKIKGCLDPGWSDCFAGLDLTHLEEGETLPSGSLHGPLERIRDLNLTLISVNSGRPSSQDSDKE